jgi:HSP20 family protein
VDQHPGDPFERLQREVERLFQDLVYRRHPATHFSERAWQPAVDVIACDERVWVRAEVPGVAKHDLHVGLIGNRLRIAGWRRPPRNVSAPDYYRAEIYYGAFERLVELPWPADPEHIKARYRDGMLEVELAPRPVSADTHVPFETESHE